MRYLTFLKYLSLPLALAATATAFPPAPYYTVYGIVRDQVGTALDAEGADLILLRGDEEVSRAPIVSGLTADQNYELKISIDAARPATRTYSPTALPAGGAFNIAVDLDGTRFYPIEASGNLYAGTGSERVRLDLNLGEDSDDDGLPDVWEQWQLFQAGHSPGDDGWPIDLIDRDGDFDKDGQSNHAEYIAGTFAGDAADRFVLDIKSHTPDAVQFEFFAVTGKTYTLERSPDGRTWTRIQFTVDDTDEPATAYRSTSVGVLPARCTPAAGTAQQIYRLTVR